MKLTPRQLFAFWLFVAALFLVGLTLIAYEFKALRIATTLHWVAGAFVVANIIAAFIAIVAPGDNPEGEKLEAAGKQGILAALKVMAGDKTDEK